jgi:hypothetical protein
MAHGAEIRVETLRPSGSSGTMVKLIDFFVVIGRPF